MSKTVNPVAVGGFIVATLVIGVALILFFTGGGLFSNKERYLLLFDTSIKGLSPGAPVTLKGVQIGQVTDIKAIIYSDAMQVLNAVELDINPDTVERHGNSEHGFEELLQRGLSAQLRMQSLLTGLLYVDVDVRPGNPGQRKPVETRLPQIPTVPTDLERLTRDLESVDIAKLSEDLQQIVGGINTLVNDPALRTLGGELQQTLASVRLTVDQMREQSLRLEQRLGPIAGHADQVLVSISEAVPLLSGKLDQNLQSLQEAMAALKVAADNTAYLTSEDSPLVYRINSAAANVSDAAEEMRRLADTLERRPESLLFGKPQEEL